MMRKTQPKYVTSLSSALLSQYLTCLTTSRSQTDKLAFDVGLREHATGESVFPHLSSLRSWVEGLRWVMNVTYLVFESSLVNKSHTINESMLETEQLKRKT